MRAIIIGNSATAVGAVEAIRQNDQQCEIVIITQEPHMIYSRPMLSHYLGGEIVKPRLAYRGADFYTKHEVTPVLESAVTSIDTEGHAVTTAKGVTYHYDKLLLTIGGVPIVPPVAGINQSDGTRTQGIYSFTTLVDTQGVIDEIESGRVRHAIVIGGGMIGIKATDALMKRGVGVTMVELAPRILSAALDATASNMLASLLREESVDVLTENTVNEIHSEDGRITSVTLRDGRTIECQLLVFGIGVRPNADIAREAGIVVNRGIVVDEFMRTSAPDVYAAGDVAEAYDLVVDMNRTVAIWPNAYRQGATAGAHMVGVEQADQGGIAMNTVEVCGIPAMSIGNGNVDGEQYEVLIDNPGNGKEYRRLVLQDDRLVGAILVGRIQRAGIYTGLIREKIDVSAVKTSLMSDHFGLLSLPDHYRKHVVTGQGIEV